VTDTRRGLLVVGAAGVLVSGYMHFYLYFWGGYRGISIDRVAGIDISRSFALNALAGLVIAELLVLSLRYDRFAKPAALLGVLFAVGAIVGYVLARTSGLLGFTESGSSTEAVISKAAEAVAIVSLGWYLLASLRQPAVVPAT
jgi:hypothetical protein